MVAVVLSISVLLQYFAALLALRLIKVTGKSTAWSLFAAGVFLMGVRRTVALYRLLSNDMAYHPDLTGELVALIISILMVCGIALIASLFQSIRKSEEALRKNEARLAESQRIAHLGNWEWSIGNGTLWWSDEVYRIFGLTPQEFGTTFEAFLTHVHPDDRELVNCSVNVALFENKPYNIDHRVVLLDGSERIVHMQAEVSFNETGDPIRMVGTVQDITERKQAENTLRESESKYRTLIEQSNDAIFLLIGERFELINSKFTEMLGFTSEEMMSPTINFMDLVAPKSRTLLAERFKSRERGEEIPFRYEFTALTKEGLEVEVEASESSIIFEGKQAIQGVLREITERKNLEAQLMQAQKMEAVGRLAGGVAHDFNNLLTVIGGNTELALASINNTNPPSYELNQIKNAVTSAAKLTKQLLAFSRKQKIEPRVVDLNQVLNETESMLRRIIGEDIELKFNLMLNLYSVKVDPAQIDQVILNLAVNARDAMPEGGRLVIETTNIELDVKYAKMNPGIDPGSYVLLAVSDTGCGMKEEVKTHIFEPFFSTKETGKGTGLGLSTVFGIVKQHDGYITVYSQEGLGTTFKIYLPKVGEKAEEIRKKLVSDEMPRGNEAVLIVEDEEEVLSLAALILKQLGYRVYKAKDGEEACKFSKMSEDPVDLVLTDLIMPGMNGVELVEQLRNKWRGIRELYLSGYTSNTIIERGVVISDAPLLSKPFMPIDLARKVREVLDEES